MNAIEEFAAQLADEMCDRNGTTLKPAVREEMIHELASLADQLVTRRLVDAMTEDSAERFNQLLDEPTVTPPIIQAFVAANVSDVQGITTQALIEFMRLYLGDS